MGKSSGYATQVAIRRAMNAARQAGLDVAGIEVSPDGTIRVFDVRAAKQDPPDLYEQWKDRL